MFRYYRFKMDGWACLLFMLIIVIPWVVITYFPSENAAIWAEYPMPSTFNTLTGILQGAMMVALFVLRRCEGDSYLGNAYPMPKIWVIVTCILVACDWGVWMAFYCGVAPLAMSVATSFALDSCFVAFSIGRRNWYGLLFSVAHIICYAYFWAMVL